MSHKSFLSVESQTGHTTGLDGNLECVRPKALESVPRLQLGPKWGSVLQVPRPKTPNGAGRGKASCEDSEEDR